MYFRSQRKNAQDVSLSEAIETGTDGASLSLMDVVCEDCDLLEQVSTRQMVQQLRSAMNTCLTEQERQVICTLPSPRGIRMGWPQVGHLK